MSYQTLCDACEAVYEIKKSEFLAFAYPITSRDDVLHHVQTLRQRYADARHHCYGYIIGDPNNTTSAGFDDDGEPNGTAGRPILNVLQHKSIGNVIIIVVRYFGGIKLGAGGLTRAYATAAQLVVDQMTLTTFIPKKTLTICTTFAHEAQVRYFIHEMNAKIVGVDYKTEVFISIDIDTKMIANFIDKLGIYGKIIDI